MGFGVGKLGGELQRIAIGVLEINRDARRTAVDFGSVVGNFQFLQALEGLIDFVWHYAEGEVEEAGAGLRRISRIFDKQIKTVVTYDHQLMHLHPSVLVIPINSTRLAGITTEIALVKRNICFEILDDKSHMINL